MKPRLKFLALGLWLASLPIHAFATGGVWCDIGDANLAFDFKASTSRDGTGGWFGVSGMLSVKIAGLPPDLASFAISDENLHERWWDGGDVRLRIGKDAESLAKVELTTTARDVDEADYRGRYELKVVLPDGTDIRKTGAVACSAD